MENIIKDFADNCWKDCFDEFKDAAVYLDDGAAECLHWYTGDRTISELSHAGAIAVRELSTSSSPDVAVDGAWKATFIYSSIDPEFYRHTLETIISMNRFEVCTVICAAHSSVLKYRSNYETEPTDSYDILKLDITRWILLRLGKELKDPIVQIIFRPIFTALINENVFVTPPFWGLMPPLNKEELNHYFEAQVDYFVSSMHSMFTNFNMKEDIYFIGNLAENVADKLEKLPEAIERRKRLTRTAGISLIIVDRTLDLCTASSHNTESLLGKILSTLSHLPGHHNDIAVSMTTLCPDEDTISEHHSTYCAPGCLASSDTSMMNLLITNKQKDVLMSLHKLLSEIIIAKESPRTRISTRISVHSLEKLVHKLRDSNNLQLTMQSSKKFQLIIAVIQALKSNKTAQIELMISLEKLILQNLAVSRDSSSILAQLSGIIKTRSTRGLSVENLLGLLVYIYALAGTEIRLPEQQEIQLKNELSEAIYDDAKSYENLISGFNTFPDSQSSKLFGNGEISKERSVQIASAIEENLHKIAGMRKSLQKYR
ncbi:sec1 family domain-containing protein 2-like isoform X2 [Athalia rosae]|nr:sec1 family domain-containing protein 2-like isoform X2 [Athalia rosae]